MTVLADSVLLADAASIDFQSVSGAYASLRIVGVLRSAKAAANVDSCLLTFNADTGANYQSELSDIRSTTPTAIQSLAAAGAYFEIPAATATATWFAAVTVDIPNYADTAKRKQFNHVTGRLSAVGTGTVIEQLATSLWNSTAAISRLTFTCSGGNMLAGSRLTLYGLAAS